MLRSIKPLGVLLALFLGGFSFGQTNQEIALIKAKEAITLMDNGNIEESIKLLQEAQELDPARIDYPYELAYAHYLKEDYEGAIDILITLLNHQDASERLFQMLGNCYDILGNSDKAIEIYNNGLAKFPNSGIIYLEKGNVFYNQKDYSSALSFYEKGIELDPSFPSNYYRASKIYCSSTEEVWGMIYGEIFMNLERNSARTAEISKLLFDTYKSEIKFTSDTSFSVSFSKNAEIDINKIKDPNNLKLPFGIGVFEPTLMLSIVGEKEINLNSLDRIRNNFIINYYKNGFDKSYPNILFAYQNKILELGHLEAYNHWILMKGDEEGFDVWNNANINKWESFVQWFNKNGLVVDNTNKFYKSQY